MRKINLILFLTPNWVPKYGGTLGLFNNNGKERIQEINPKFNRAVIFTTSDVSFHGFPEPIKCPRKVFRNTLAVYFYQNSNDYDQTNSKNYKTGWIEEE